MSERRLRIAGALLAVVGVATTVYLLQLEEGVLAAALLTSSSATAFRGSAPGPHP